MFPTISDLLHELLGVNIPLPVQTFGFFVAISFLGSAYLLAMELKRKEKEGLLFPLDKKVLVGKPISITEIISNGLTGFLLGFKLIYAFTNYASFVDDPQGFILSLEGNWIGGILTAGVFIYLKYREKEKTKLETPVWVEEPMHPYQHVGNMTLIAAFAGLTGAKIFHNLENWNTFIADPMGALLSFDGLTMYGGLILASISLIIYGRKYKIPTLHLIDSSAPSIMIGYAVGRIGCHMSGDGDWGIPSLNPKPFSWLPDWMWSFDYPHNVVNDGVPIINCTGEKFCNHLVPSVYPTPFYETIMCLFLFLILWNIRKKIKTPGVLFSIYLIFNGIERFFIEKIRVNTLYDVNGFRFTQAELISTILFFLGLVGIFYFRKLEKKKLVGN